MLFLLHVDLYAPDLQRVLNAAAHLDRLLQTVGVADGMNLVRRCRTHIVDGERRPRAADLRRSREPLPVDGHRFCACGAQFVDDAQEIVVMNEVEVRILARFRRRLAVVERDDDAWSRKRRKAALHALVIVARPL